MIERLVAALRAADLDLDWRDLSDALWLAHVTGPQRPADSPATADLEPVTPGSGGADQGRTPVESSDTPASDDVPLARGDPVGLGRGAGRQGDAPAFDLTTPKRYALPGRLEIGRALRPFKQRRRSPRDLVFDTEATIDTYCETRVLVPITAPAQERWFRDVAVVADGEPTMVVWQDTIAALADLLERHGAFERVTQWTLSGDGDEIQLVSRAGVAHTARELVDHDGRRLTLVVTDCVGPMWRGAAVWAAMREWGRSNPVVLVQTLPPRLWPSTALGDADVVLTPHRRGEPNQQLGLHAPWWWDEDDAPEQATPVVTLDEERLGAWAGMVMGDADVPVAGVVTQPPQPEHDEVAVMETMDASALVATFRATVSDEASRLATLLSAVDVDLPVARLLLDELIPGARLTPLAEVLAGGLLKPVGGDAYEFAPDVREILQDSLTAPMAISVWRTVAPYLEATTGRRPPFSLLLGYGSDDDAPALGDVAAGVIDRLGLKAPLTRSRGDEVEEPASGGEAPAEDVLERFDHAQRRVLPTVPHLSIDTETGIEPGEVIFANFHVDTQEFGDGETGTVLRLPDVDELLLRVLLTADEHFEVVGEELLMLVLRRHEDRSPTLRFALRADAAGASTLTAVVTVGGRPAGRVARSVWVGEPPSTVRVEAGAPAPDLTVVVTESRDRFTVLVTTPHLPELGDSVTEWRLERSALASYMDAIAGSSGRDKSGLALLSGVGMQLFEATPDAFKEVYWALRDAGKPLESMLIVSPEIIVPWEIMVPTRNLVPTRNREQLEPLGVAHAVARWPTTSIPPRRRFEFQNGYVIAPRYPLPHTSASSEGEADYVVSRLAGERVSPASIETLDRALTERPASMLHFACHTEPSAFGSSSVVLDDDQMLGPSTMLAMPGLTEAFKLKRPFVFLNACSMGRGAELAPGRDLAAAFARLGASGVLAPMWQVTDEAAGRFAIEFYEAIRRSPDVPCAEVVRGLRRQAFLGDRDDLSWAAYAYFGDPFSSAIVAER